MSTSYQWTPELVAILRQAMVQNPPTPTRGNYLPRYNVRSLQHHLEMKSGATPTADQIRSKITQVRRSISSGPSLDTEHDSPPADSDHGSFSSHQSIGQGSGPVEDGYGPAGPLSGPWSNVDLAWDKESYDVQSDTWYSMPHAGLGPGNALTMTQLCFCGQPISQYTVACACASGHSSVYPNVADPHDSGAYGAGEALIDGKIPLLPERLTPSVGYNVPGFGPIAEVFPESSLNDNGTFDPTFAPSPTAMTQWSSIVSPQTANSERCTTGQAANFAARDQGSVVNQDDNGSVQVNLTLAATPTACKKTKSDSYVCVLRTSFRPLCSMGSPQP
ncbi:hypothetical protein B0H17DRAFT_563730 [Mycena rosella]|uniref:Uncharacterized protein n=1 Tax=Mycena rosella TaxID=1033263 RepID=A0AAD7BNW0_MYCRO|nr:hypothetical protein B0H17DRAFT_563730 [Mycena rosella]